MIKENWKFLEYTYLHRKALKYLVETLIINPEDKKALRKRAEIHDLDKALMYTIYPKSMASEMHRRHAAHHMENDLEKSRLDFMEAVLDYECAALTKPDKPLNAYDTVKNIPNRYADELIEIMKELGIDRSYVRKADNAFNAFMADYLPVTEEKVLSEIYSYVGRIFEYELKKISPPCRPDSTPTHMNGGYKMSKRCDKCEYWKNPSATTLYATCTCKDANECGVSTFMTHVCSLDPRSQLEKEKTDMEAEFEEIKQKACALIEGMRMDESLSDTISEITSTILAAAAKADHYNAVCECIKAE